MSKPTPTPQDTCLRLLECSLGDLSSRSADTHPEEYCRRLAELNAAIDWIRGQKS